MSRARILFLSLSVVALFAAGCGDDAETGSDASTTTASSADDPDGADDTTTTTASTVPDAEAEDPPADAGNEDDGLGDPVVFVAALSGETEVPGPGDPAATGRAEVESDVNGDLCFDMVAEGLDSDVTDSHIHEAAAGDSGGVVIPIGTPTSTDGDTATWTDVCISVDSALVDRINADPAAFYANIHTSNFGGGAIRGQLEQATIFDLTLS